MYKYSYPKIETVPTAERSGEYILVFDKDSMPVLQLDSKISVDFSGASSPFFATHLTRCVAFFIGGAPDKCIFRLYDLCREMRLHQP